MEPLSQTSIVAVQDSSQVAVARRAATEFAKIAGLDEQRISAVNIVVVELANNLLQHAGGGNLYLRYLEPVGALEIASVDHGKGMHNIERCLEDGFSTASTPGLGLGAVRRFALRFSGYSLPGRSTVIAARLAERKAAPDFSVISTAIQGETLSGDGWSVSEDGRAFLVVDGLGHGMFAADAAKAAISIFQKYQNSSPQVILEMAHAALRSTRGAAAAVARVNPGTSTLDFAGIGNISCVLMGPERSQSLVSHNGTLGHQMRRVQQFQYPCQPSDLLLMQSDGLTTQSRLGIPPSLLLQSPSVVAPLLFSEQVRGRDDATILVTRLA
ncbi:ATP-binding SpoIIE family protein phosphatase [Paracidobacterium acidisoli]|uniref:Serine/threonine protein kinase n=1 Tax=Paracidobacterium acidisoli TaxID=2303751 RepID=A0A372IT78_9BACT|nr:ATP-binding SpoIIE family protein phosphatase [Paracidobacterium acidisoli]MBT9329569.1 SpoIIE family protein phosphatase [Paracidobacterium acidisoli]